MSFLLFHGSKADFGDRTSLKKEQLQDYDVKRKAVIGKCSTDKRIYTVRTKQNTKIQETKQTKKSTYQNMLHVFFCLVIFDFFLEQTRLLPKLLFVFSVLLVVLHFLPRKKKGENNSKYRIPPDFVLFLVVCFCFSFSTKKTLELSSITKIFFRYLK